MSKVCIAVKTKDRSPRANYLRGTLLNLERAGVLASPHLQSLWIVDSGSGYDWLEDQIPTNVRWNVDTGRRTLHQNAARCIEVASRESAGAYAMVLEDDLDFVDGFLESVVAWLGDHPGELMYVLGANYAQLDAPSIRERGCWEYPVSAFYGAQALVWRREDAAQLVAWLGPDPFYPGRDGQEVRDHGHDLLLQKWGRERGAEHFLASAPSVVQHVGEDSGIGNRFFQFQSWPGRNWRYERRVVA